MPKLSIIVPVYNVGKYVNTCIQSIVKQTFTDWELILVNDGSKDNSGDICDEWAKKEERISVYHIPNGGVSGARNFGLQKAKGEYITFVDGDDWIDAQMYTKLVSKMEEGADITFCRFVQEYTLESRSVFHNETNLKNMETRPFDYSNIIYELTFQSEEYQTKTNNVFGSVCRSLFRKEIVEREGISFQKEVKLAEDRLFLMHYLMYCQKASVIDEYYYHYRMERTDSAVASMTQGYQKELFDRRNQMLAYEFDIIQANPQMSILEKRKLIDYEKYKLAFDVVINEISANPQYKQRLKILFKEDVLKSALPLRAFKQMKELGFTLKRRILYLLIKFRMWNTIKVLLRK